MPNPQLVAGLCLYRPLHLLFSLFLWQLQQQSCDSLAMTFRPPCLSLGKHQPQPHALDSGVDGHRSRQAQGSHSSCAGDEALLR